MTGFVITTHRKILEVDPDEVMDYIIDLTDWIGTEAITSVSFTNTSTAEIYSVAKNSAPLTVPGYGDVAADKAVVFWVRLGTLGTSGTVTFSVTVGARKKDIAYTVVVKNG